jgi:hypothetical protein
LWSPELELIRSSNKQGYQNWRNEHLWSASSSLKNEKIYTKKSDANQSFGFSSFRLVAHEIERLQKEARELTRRKAEEEHAEEIKAHDGKSFIQLYTTNGLLSFCFRSCKTFRSF